MSGINRSPRPTISDTKIGGGSSYQFTKNSTSLDLYPNLDRDGDTVYVQQPTNQKTKRLRKQPTTYVEKHLDNDNEVRVSTFKYEEFVWWSKSLTDEIPLLYKRVLENLRVWKSYYSFELQGFTCFRHEADKNRRCAVKRIYLPQVRCGKYHPYASVKHKRRASMRTLDRLECLEKKVKKLNGSFEKNNFDCLVKLDLTLPKWVSLEWDNEDIQVRIREALQLFLKLLHNRLFPEPNPEVKEVYGLKQLYDFLLARHRSQFGLICNHHFWSTQHPLEPHRHLHLTMPNVCYNKSENRFYRFNPYLNEKLVKECWEKALLEYGLWVERKNEEGKRILPDCGLGYIKFLKRDKVINRLSYCCRKPTEDMIMYLRREDLEFFEDSKEFANFLINYTPRVVNLGFLTNLKRFGYISNKSKSMVCPICGGEMVALQGESGLIESLDRPPPHAPKLLRDRAGIWYVLSERCGSG